MRPHDALTAPDTSEFEKPAGFRVISLNALVRMELTSFGNVSCMHLRDMLDVGLIDAFWPARLPPDLAARLQQLIDTPES